MKHIGLIVRVAVLPIWLAFGVSAREVEKGAPKDGERFLEVVTQSFSRWDDNGKGVLDTDEMNRRIG